jgi:hypothetical protein
MTSKLFEVRDRATAMIVLAVKLDSVRQEEMRLLRAAGYGDGSDEYVVVVSLRGGVSEAQDDPFRWANQRTMGEAHREIREHFDALPTGAVIDVRVRYGEQAEPALTDFGGVR